MIESETKSVLPGSGKSGAYGVRTLRQLRKNNQEPSERLKKKIDTTYSYFLEEVDPVIGDLITHLLCEQPIDVPGAMLTYLTKRKEKMKEAEQTAEKKDADVEQREATEEPPVEETPPAPKVNKRPKKEAKLYLAVSIGPLVTKLVNRIAVTRPKKVVDYLCEELNEMIYGGDEETKREIEVDERFEMYKGMDGPKQPKDGDTVEVEVETPAVELKSYEPAEEPTPSSTVKEPVVAEDDAPSVDVTVAVKAQSIQFAVLGMDNAGKSSILNMLQGKGHQKTKPTIGFRPTSMMLDEQTTIRFYDIGGSKKIRDIWGQYYHDAHAIIYVVDLSEQDETRRAECKALFDATMAHPFVAGKPLLVFGNKADVDNGMSIEDLSNFLNLSEYTSLHGNIAVSACSAALMESEDEAVDDRIESNLEGLIKTVQDNFMWLNERVEADSRTKSKEDQKKRLQRERTVLRNKIVLAFADDVKEECRPDETDIKKSNPEDLFTREEGLTFLASELGEEVAAMPPTALEIASMVGYQRLALQIVGSLKVPISKKKDPMSWEEIHALVVEIRNELGLATSGLLPSA